MAVALLQADAICLTEALAGVAASPHPWLLLSADAVRAGAALLVLQVVQDELARQQGRTAAAVEAANAALQRRLLRYMCHHIRIPAQALTAAVEAAGAPSTAAERVLQAAARSAAAAVSHVLDELGALDAWMDGTVTLHQAVVPVADLLDAILAAVPSTLPRGVRVVGAVDPSAPTATAADKDRLFDVAMNFVDNACAATPAGSVVRVTAAGCAAAVPTPLELAEALQRPAWPPEDEAASMRKPRRQRVPVGAHFLLIVHDGGGGISPADMAKLFSPFERLEGTSETGLSLAISKRIMDLHGGAVGCDSAPSRGTTFWLSVRAAADDSVVLVARSESDGRDASHATVAPPSSGGSAQRYLHQPTAADMLHRKSFSGRSLPTSCSPAAALAPHAAHGSPPCIAVSGPAAAHTGDFTAPSVAVSVPPSPATERTRSRAVWTEL